MPRFFQTLEAFNTVGANTYLNATLNANVTSVVRASSGYTVTYGNGSNLYVYGTALTYGSDLAPSGGTITGYAYYASGQQVYAASGLDMLVGSVATNSSWATNYLEAANIIRDNFANYLDLAITANGVNYTGSSGADRFNGGASNDILMGGTGADYLYGLGGDDWIEGGDGNDYIVGGNNSPYGVDTLQGGNGDDIIYGGSGIDIIYGGSGADYIYGDSGVDWLEGGDGDDYIYAGSNSPSSETSIYKEVIVAGAGNDFLYAADNLAVVAIGGEGSDTVYGSSRADWVEGGIGDTANDMIYGYAGDDTVIGGGGSDRLDAGDGADLLITGAGQSYMSGGAGADTLWGGNGNDTLVGGSGADLMYGLGGNDQFIFNSSNDLAASVRDTINGFARASGNFDAIDLPRGYSSLTSYTQVGADTLISIAMPAGGVAEILVLNALMASVQSSVYFFAS